MKLVSRNGDALDATFSVEETADGLSVVLESRGPNRNPDYTAGLQTLLERLAELDAVLVDAYLDTRETQRQRLSLAERRLELPAGVAFPLSLGSAPAGPLAAALKTSQRRIGKPAGAAGGNDTRRMVLMAEPGQDPFPAFPEAVLAGSPRVGVVYVPASRQSAENLSIGLEQGIWGFSSETMARSNYLQDFRLLREGDMVFLGHRGPSPRVKAGGWAGEQVSVGQLGMITGMTEVGTDAVWPDGLYPYRLKIDFLAESTDFGAADVGKEVMEALRYSANQQGRVVVLPLGGLLLAGGAADLTARLSLDGPLDKLVSVAARQEQARLRKQRLGSAKAAACDLCGRSFPTRYLRIGHIKKRSLCTDEEKLDPNVVMTACVECDALFEAKELIVDDTGIVRVVDGADVTTDLKSVLVALDGRKCSAFSAGTSKYFEFHRAS